MLHLLSDCFSRLSSASRSSKKNVVVLNSSVVKKSLFIMYKLGYIRYFTILSYKYIKIYLKYSDSARALRGVVALSKPTLQFYVKYKKLQNFAFNNKFSLNGFIVCSTPRGLFTDIECVLTKTGGKALFFIC